MAKTPVIAVYDVGKSNKKFFLFDEGYRIAHAETIQLPETWDDDGFPSEDIPALSSRVQQTIRRAAGSREYDLKAVNFSAYGASLVHLDAADRVTAPLYNYLKPFPETIAKEFGAAVGNESAFMQETGAPVLGFLNSGLQLYWLKKTKPQLFQQIRCSLHLPQFISFLVTGKKFSEITSLGCHTALWNFVRQDYHRWVYTEGLEHVLAPLISSSYTEQIVIQRKQVTAGPGLHDSSAALLPYLRICHEPFVLISTGTWNISLNPFNNTLLTATDLENNCLCYLNEKGAPVKASRLFAGYMHEQSVAAIATHFNLQPVFYQSIQWDPQYMVQAAKPEAGKYNVKALTDDCNVFRDCPLGSFSSATEAYYYLIGLLVHLQRESVRRVVHDTSIKKIFVDGGFSHNPVFMHLLASAIPEFDVYAASVPQASAIGAALAIHAQWNKRELPENLVQLRLVRPEL